MRFIPDMEIVTVISRFAAREHSGLRWPIKENT